MYAYDPTQDNWTALPPLPVRHFGLGQVSGKLVAVGGEKKSNNTITNEVYNYDERSKKWKHVIPPMPTARDFPGVLSLQSALVVAGGNLIVSDDYIYSDAVEVFKLGTSQWYRTDPLPIACLNISLIAVGNTCYALGGYDDSQLNQVHFASVDALLSNAVLANHTTHARSVSGSSDDAQSAWKSLESMPTFQPSAAMLADKLLAIGGREKPREGTDKKEIYMYSSRAMSWIYISDLPAPRYASAAAILSSLEIVVIGGSYHSEDMRSLYKGTLCIL